MDEETLSEIRNIDLALVDIVRLATDTVDTLSLTIRRLTGLSLPPAALRILREVRDTTPGLMQLAASVELSQPTVSVHIQELEKKGLVTRSPHPSDGRGTIIRITPQGEWIANMVETSRETDYEELFRDWNKDDTVSLARLLDRFRSDKKRCVLLNRQRQALETADDEEAGSKAVT
jgi:DNA-binding MarR family transcriptional regulator